MNSDDRIIIALDVPNAVLGLNIVNQLGDAVSFYKIGLGMLTGGGMALANELKQDLNKKIFMDLKLFDIGATIERAVKGLTQYNIDFLTVNGDPQVVSAAVQGKKTTDTKILAVTFLTSLDREDLNKNLIKEGSINELVLERSIKAFEAGADGVIASPHEAHMIKGLSEAQGKLIVTPGIRPLGFNSEDQKRVMTPDAALANGADHIVIGRPVIKAKNPRLEIKKILETIETIK
ncbi:MAG: orotidine-5'-phosphate decarboxylase [Paracoccaceae bacterium]|nr:MAG: orotidine-5'-phosphate decarboxylase [Paracoccaceae bacterium]|tara:strand:+ start:67 stop:768 length:702 start_codon:yes stop_codon:yes gene_type:complete